LTYNALHGYEANMFKETWKPITKHDKNVHKVQLNKSLVGAL